MQQIIHISPVTAFDETDMSKQLALSSAFATLAMAAMVLTHTPSQFDRQESEGYGPVQAELSLPDLPQPSFIR